MANYRITVILKTDIVDSTPRLAEQTQAEMGLQRRQHRKFISETASQHRGSIFDEEGDAYWIEFPSVTDAVLAAMEMHQSLQSMQAGKGEQQRLAIRTVVTVGDVLHQGNDTLGMTMSLTARIEKITPPDEIYLSQGAWLALNKAEVQTSFVDEFNLKGFSEPEKIYKVAQKHKTRVILNQYIVFVGVRGWVSFTKSNEIEVIEDFLSEYDDMMRELCENYGGVIRNAIGDEYLLTFAVANSMLTAVEKLCRSWKVVRERRKLGLSVAMHEGNLNILRSYLYGESIINTVFLQQLNTSIQSAADDISVLASGKVRIEFRGTDQEGKFQELDLKKIRRENNRLVARELGAYLLMVE